MNFRGTIRARLGGLLVMFREGVAGRLIRYMQFNKLLKRGLQLGKDVYIPGDVSIDPSFCWLVAIGDKCTISNRVRILAHDASTKVHTGYTKIGRVSIGERTFIGAESVILPGVCIGSDVIVGAGSVVTRDVPDGVLVAGNPAVVLGSTEAYAEKHEEKMRSRPVYPQTGWTVFGGITEANKVKMRAALQDGIGYIE